MLAFTYTSHNPAIVPTLPGIRKLPEEFISFTDCTSSEFNVVLKYGINKVQETSALVTFSDYFLFSILLQSNISKHSKYFRSNFLRVQVSGPYNVIFQI